MTTSKTYCPVSHKPCELFDENTRLKAEVEKISRLVEVDKLTGYYNFQHLSEALVREMERTRRTGHTMGLIMADLDNFKSVNDTHGHQAGNVVLQTVSALWRKSIRLTDIPCRYGGEEFVFLLPGTTLSQSIRTAERLRSITQASPIGVDSKTLHITASFGVEIFRPNDAFSADAFIEKADFQLLEAKKNGKNMVCYKESINGKAPTEIRQEERIALFIKRWPSI
jgi:diguanylate cyclase (GGDEF)-like protein